MSNTKSTKRALLSSIMAMLICVAMLIGTTFAWFTDSASTAVNKIQAGTLDVQLLDANDNNIEGGTLKWQKAAGAPADEQVLWEPGCTYNLEFFKIKNNGNLALKYKIVISGIAGDAELNEAIVWSYKLADGTDFPITSEGHLLAGEDTDLITISGHMKEEAGNEYQGLSIEGIAITVYATQYTSEYDSNNNTYDAAAARDEFRQAVTVAGIAGYEGREFASIQAAYDAISEDLRSRCGLGQESMSAADFNAFFTDGGKITWNIYGNQKVTNARTFSFGRAANYFGTGLHITEINIIGGNSSAALDLNSTDGTFALPYNWWNDGVNTNLQCKGITFYGIKSMPSGTYQDNSVNVVYTFDDCTFNGSLYSYQNFPVNMTIKNCVFNAPANQGYAFFAQGAGGRITLDGNKFNGYIRGINLQRPTADFIVTNNTIKSSVSEPDRGAIQLTDGKSFVVSGNTVDVNGGNAFWFHSAATNAAVQYTITNNTITAPYLANDDTSFGAQSRITSSGNTLHITHPGKCMEKGAAAATDSNVTLN